MRTTSRLAALALVLQCGCTGLALAAASVDKPPVDTRSMAAFFEPATAAPKAPDPEGFLQRWLLLEPVTKPNTSNAGFTATYVRNAFAASALPGAATAVPKAGGTAQVGGETLRWHALDAKLFDVKLFSFAQGLHKPVYGVIFWATTVVDSPREMRDVRLAVGSNSASIWWLNGKETAGLFNDRRMVMDDVLSDRLTLRKGSNVIRGAVINGPGLSSFCVRFVDEAGRPITDLTTHVR